MIKDRDLAAKIIKREESCDLDPHMVNGVPHQGWGRNMTIELSDAEEEILGEDYDIDEPRRWTQDEADAMFEVALDTRIKSAMRGFKKVWNDLNPLRQAIVVSMVYQNGYAGIFGPHGFVKFCLAVRNGDWQEAYVQMLDSKWAKSDSPARAERHAKAMRDGTSNDYQEIEDWKQEKSEKVIVRTDPQLEEMIDSLRQTFEAVPPEVKAEIEYNLLKAMATCLAFFNTLPSEGDEK